MMRRLGNVLITLILVSALAAGAGSLALGRPVLATVIRSQSMRPLYSRGDVVFLWNWPGKVGEGDIVLFKPSKGSLAGSWTLHRIVDTEPSGAFLTKGDAATLTDQADKLAGPVERKDIVAKAVTLGRFPLKIPWAGGLSLKLSAGRETLQKRVLVPALVLMVLLAASEFVRQDRRRRRGQEVDPRLVFIGVGTILSVLLIAMTLFQTVRVTLIYEVGPDPGVILGQPVGIITPGQVVSKQLASLDNRGFLPMILLLTEHDANVTADAGIEVLHASTARKVNIDVTGNVEGSYKSLIELSLVFPLLPMPVVAYLAKVSHWLGALAGCILPGVVVIMVGLLEPANLRRTARDIRLWRRRVEALLPW